jgi:hypothetical protein
LIVMDDLVPAHHLALKRITPSCRKSQPFFLIATIR